MTKSPEPTPDSQGPIPGSPEWELLMTAYHESGHAVMAMILGRSIQKISVVPGQIQAGGTRLGKCEFKKGRIKSSNDWLEDEVLIMLAGMVAESKISGEYCHQGASQDLQVARRLLDTRAATERQMEKLERRMLSKAEYLLEEDSATKAIEFIAAELVEKEVVSGRAAQHLFNMAKQQCK